MIINNYLVQIDKRIKDISQDSDFHKMLSNILRVYYLGIEHILSVKIINEQKENLSISETDIEHLDNSGWILPEPDNLWISDEYMPQLKLNFLLSLYTLMNITGLDNFEKKFRKNFTKLSEVMLSNGLAKKDTNFNILGNDYNLNVGDRIKISDEDILSITDNMLEAFRPNIIN